MSNYILNVGIVDHDVYRSLLDGHYKLCIANMVKGAFSIVWSGETFHQHTTFQLQWSEDFGLDGLELAPSSKKKGDIALVQVGKEFLPNNRPVIVSLETVNLKGIDELTPVVKLMVWFERTLTLGTRFEHFKSLVVEVDFTGYHAPHQTISYTKDEYWSIDGPSGSEVALPKFYQQDNAFVARDIDLDPYQFAKHLRTHPGPSTTLTPTPRFLFECEIQFTSAEAANDVWKYLKYKIIHNIVQEIPVQTADLSIKVRLGWERTTFLKSMMVGENDNEKLKNAFINQLKGLAVKPASYRFTEIHNKTIGKKW